MKQIIIVGAGASGLVAAIKAAAIGAAVTVLEQNDRPGRKICATGNGRCNMTNLNNIENAYRGSHPEFVKDALKQFSVKDTLSFFQKLGICTTDRSGWIYPRSNQAQSIVDVLTMKARSLKVKLKTNQYVTGVSFTDGHWNVHTNGWTYTCDAVILANGSKASSVAGSSESGYEISRSLGHHLIEPLPALTALKCRGNFFSGWSGVRTEGKITLYINDIPQTSQQGELQLTDYGVSGIPVFQISRYAIRAIYEKKKVELSINFFPELTKQELQEYLGRRKNDCPYKNEKELLTGLFPEKLIRVLSAQKDLISAITDFRLSVKSGLSFEQAQICSGGVDTSEVDSHTMESRLHKGLYFAGELLDIDGTCGGYNLQWAWSSGATAGIHAAKEENS
mgnify:FL=1